MPLISVAGVDPAFANFGIARMLLDLDTLALSVDDLILIETEKSEAKTVRASSDDLRRAGLLHDGFQKGVAGCSVVFSEVPSGTKDAKSARGLGIAVGVLASSPVEIIQVSPLETKLHSVGSKTATKPQMIAWGTQRYPHAPWKRDRDRPTGRFTNNNEHLADAIGVVFAGIQTPQFRQIRSVLQGVRLA